MAVRIEPSEHPDLVVRIGPLGKRHLRAVMRIDALSYPRPWSRGIFQSELSQAPRSRHYLVARVDGEVVGYSGLMFVGDDAHVTTVAVDPDYRRERIATRLMLVMAREAIRRGATALTLEVRVSNTAAQDLYRRFGFVPAGIRRRYYAPEGEDALVMWAHDIGEPDFRARLATIEGDVGSTTLLDPPLSPTDRADLLDDADLTDEESSP